MSEAIIILSVAAPSLHERRGVQQVAGLMLAGRVGPRQRGDRHVVVHADAEPRLVPERGAGRRALPGQGERDVAVRLIAELAVEGVERVAQAAQRVQRAHDRTVQVLVHLRGGVVVAVDVAPDMRAIEQVHVVATGERAHVVDLRDARQEELHGAGGQIVLVVAAERRIVGAVDLVEVQVRGGGAGCGAGFAVRVAVDRADERVHVLVGDQSLQAAVELVGADVDHADAVMGVQHVDGVVRADAHPVRHRFHMSGEQAVQQQRGQREIIDAVDLGGDLDLLLVIRMHLDEDLQPALDALLAQTADEFEALRRHEAGGVGLLGTVADGVEPDVADVRGGHLVEDRHQVFPAFSRIGVDVHLLRGERGPHQAGLAAASVVGERQTRARPVDTGQLLLGGAVGVDAAQRQEHRIVFRLLPLGEHVLELPGLPAHVVHDGVDHDAVRLGEVGHVVPRAQPRIDRGVVDRVEARVRAVEGREERQDVHALIHPLESRAQDLRHGFQRAVPQSVGVGD